ncbi:MAG: hydantoinase/oxoprolinase family protein [Parvibaculaceae bacterium]
MSYQIAVDVGGTFTDLVLQDGGGRVRSFKAPTTPGQISGGILHGLSLIADTLGQTREELLGACSKLACGTTVATNAILEGKYARTALLCTQGFRDTLLIREGGKQDTYNIAIDYPPPYIPRRLTIGIEERVNSEGGIEIPLSIAQAGAALDEVKGWGVEAIAVALLWSIANPEHEIKLGNLIEKICPGLPYSLSHRTSPTLREYRRTSATAIDASLKPLAGRAINELENELRAAGLKGLLTFVTSSGGQTAAREVVARPISLCLSGPSAAPEAANQVLRREPRDNGNIIVVDMGGTSFDISIVSDWTIPMHREGVIAGHVFGVPSVEVKTIGAGGGSIARVDAGGFVHVGPESSGSYPGPACYNRGGVLPTVTDSNLVRGFLSADKFAGGTMTLSPAKAKAAIEEQIARPLGIDVLEAASLIGLTVEQNMVAAIEEITIRQGIDPREYTMMVGGAAAGLHAVPMARELGIKHVVVSPVAGVLSAFGILASDIKSSFSRSFAASSARFDFTGVNATLAALAKDAEDYLERMRVPAKDRQVEFSVEARYRGQVWQLSLALPRGEIADAAALADVLEAFHRLHEKVYFVRSRDAIEFTEWSAMAIGMLPKSWQNADRAVPAEKASGETRTVYLRELGGVADLPVHQASALKTGQPVAGPALIDQNLTTVVLYPDTSAKKSENGNLWIEIGAPRA